MATDRGAGEAALSLAGGREILADMGLAEEIAAAVSGHRFEAALPHLHEDVVWETVAAAPLVGREAVAAAMRQAAQDLAPVRTTFSRFRVLSAGDVVVVDAEAVYEDEDGVSSVASCDLYDFADDRLVLVRSYNVEV